MTNDHYRLIYDKRPPVWVVVLLQCYGDSNPGLRRERPLSQATRRQHPSWFLSKSGAKVLLFFDMTKYFGKKIVFFVKKVQISLISHHTYDKKETPKSLFYGMNMSERLLHHIAQYVVLYTILDNKELVIFKEFAGWVGINDCILHGCRYCLVNDMQRYAI